MSALVSVVSWCCLRNTHRASIGSNPELISGMNMCLTGALRSMNGNHKRKATSLPKSNKSFKTFCLNAGMIYVLNT